MTSRPRSLSSNDVHQNGQIDFDRQRRPFIPIHRQEDEGEGRKKEKKTHCALRVLGDELSSFEAMAYDVGVRFICCIPSEPE